MKRHALRQVLLAAAVLGAQVAAAAEATLPAQVATLIRTSGLPERTFGLHVRDVETPGKVLVSLNEDQRFRLASTAKVVTTLAALDVIGSGSADVLVPTTAPVADRLAGPATKIAVIVRPTSGSRAAISLRPAREGVSVVNAVAMAGGCSAWVQTKLQGKSMQITVGGRWDRRCGSREVAQVDVAHGTSAASPSPPPVAAHDAASEPAPVKLTDIVRVVNKHSDNVAARGLMQSLSLLPPSSRDATTADPPSPRRRMREWLQAQGIDDEDIHIELGSGESHAEQGKPRALVELLRNAWRKPQVREILLESLPVAGVDGTLAGRMRAGPAAGNAFLKTGTLYDTRALAGYVRARSGKVYAVALLVNDARAARARGTLDRVVEWVAQSG